MSNVSECPYAMSAEVQHQCKVIFRSWNRSGL